MSGPRAEALACSRLRTRPRPQAVRCRDFGSRHDSSQNGSDVGVSVHTARRQRRRPYMTQPRDALVQVMSTTQCDCTGWIAHEAMRARADVSSGWLRRCLLVVFLAAIPAAAPADDQLVAA